MLDDCLMEMSDRCEESARDGPTVGEDVPLDRSPRGENASSRAVAAPSSSAASLAVAGDSARAAAMRGGEKGTIAPERFPASVVGLAKSRGSDSSGDAFRPRLLGTGAGAISALGRTGGASEVSVPLVSGNGPGARGDVARTAARGTGGGGTTRDGMATDGRASRDCARCGSPMGVPLAPASGSWGAGMLAAASASCLLASSTPHTSSSGPPSSRLPSDGLRCATCSPALIDWPIGEPS